MKKTVLLLGLILLSYMGLAQDGNINMTPSVNDSTFEMVNNENGIYLNVYDNGGPGGNYSVVQNDVHITVMGTCENTEFSISLQFLEFDIDPHDTLFVYDGPSINSPRLVTANNNLNPLNGVTLYPSNNNMSGKLTIRFKTTGQGQGGSGFAISVRCRSKCETVTPVIDTFYFKTRNGVVVDTGYTRWVLALDTVWNADSTSYHLDSSYFRGVHLCVGEDVIFCGHGEYTNHYGYNPNDSWSLFDWNFGNGDTASGVGLTRPSAHYKDLDCYDVILRITDGRGCKSTLMESVRVRIAKNPIKTIYDLNTQCNTDSLSVNVGYDGANATITMEKIEFAQTKSKTISCKTFIPDGSNTQCPQADGDNCFRAIITFDDFPAGRMVSSKEDICSVCINYEHSFMGDYRISLICPSGKKAVLKYGQQGHDPDVVASNIGVGKLIPPGSHGGSGQFTGIPYGGGNDGGYDGKCSSGSGFNTLCDSVCNMFGIGYTYCFSRNGDYLLNRGEPCNTPQPIDKDYFCTQDWQDQFTDYTFITIPPPYAQAGTTAANSTHNTKHPSDYENKRDYYLPANDFDSLVGCPLNGDWAIQICDYWPADNGWIFEWSMDICGIQQGLGCEYQVGIDSVLWTPDSTYGDFDLGYWRGVNIKHLDNNNSLISTPDTAGTFPIKVRIFDEFGCVWDTMTKITTVWTPEPNIGDTIILCDVETVTLDARDRHTAITNQSFAWDPFGQITDTIITTNNTGSSTLYTVEVENNQHKVSCRARDSVRVNVFVQPTPNFDPGIYPLEGCEPFTLHFDNTSQGADHYLWVFGDGDSSTAMSPSHTYATGQYGFKYFVSTDNGCQDSLVYEDLITVYSSPVARFSWEPVNPTVLHPQVTFQNLTIPQSDENMYYWEIQYDRDNPISYHTLRDVNPTFEWYTDGEDISGTYIARLIAKTENMGPSGLVIECRDTIENNILLVNDFLQFPNVVTPNGDGVNDKFVIKNLIDGLGYPNNSLAIYDRWGKRVYYKENIASEEDFWDPAKDNIPDGTYFWRFVGKGYLGDIQRNGVVEVVR